MVQIIERCWKHEGWKREELRSRGWNENKSHYKFHRDQMNESLFKIEGTNFGGLVHGRRCAEFSQYLKKNRKYIS